jgi:hypothetical protein
MFRKLRDAMRPSKGRSLARSFSRLGWIGFWLQVVLGSFSVIIMVYYFVFSSTSSVPRAGLAFVEYLTIADLLILVFTIGWSYRYTRLARRIQDADKRPSEPYVLGVIWTGVVASAFGMIVSMVVLLIEVANVLFYFLRTPQAGMPVFQTSATEAVYWVSAVDMVSLMALVLVLCAEMLVLVFSLWLLFRTMHGSPEFPQTATEG